MSDLANDVIEKCLEFANNNDYDEEWAFDIFQEQFAKAKAEYLKTNFDACCENVKNMAAVIDAAKIGWTKEQIIEWLKQPAKEKEAER